MKRLIGLTVLLVVLCACVPASYGAPAGYYYLIYNVSMSVKGADANTNAKVTIPMKGYLVLKFVDGCDAPYDANLILYGSDINTPKKQKAYVQLNSSDSDRFLGADAWHRGGMMFIDCWGRRPFNFEMLLEGNESLKDIGYGTTKVMLAGSVKGVIEWWYNFVLGPSIYQDVSGTSNVSATLWTAATKYANTNHWTQDQIISDGDPNKDGLIPMLTDKGYSAATIP